MHDLRFAEERKIRTTNVPLPLELSHEYCVLAPQLQLCGPSPPKLARYECGTPFTIAKFAATVGGASSWMPSFPPSACTDRQEDSLSPHRIQPATHCSTPGHRLSWSIQEIRSRHHDGVGQIVHRFRRNDTFFSIPRIVQYPAGLALRKSPKR